MVAAILVVSAFTLKTADTENNTTASKVDNGSYTVDTQASEVKWTGKKIAYGHFGTLNIASGSLVFSGDALTGGKFDFDMNSIKCDDIEDADKNAKLIGHLKSDDFFSVKDHPVSSFVITKVEKASGDANYKITGDLSIKGITHPLTFDAMLKDNDGTINATAKLTFDRAKYEVKFQSGTWYENLGDKAIYDDIEMEIKLVAKKDDSSASN